MKDITFTLKKRYGNLPVGYRIFHHERFGIEVWGLPKDKNHFWTLDFINKHPEIFERN